MVNRRNTIYGLLILTLVTGLFTGRAFFFNVAYLLAGLLVISFLWSWTSVRWISIGRRTGTRRTQVGRTLDEQFIVQNRALLPKLWIDVRDESTLPGHRVSHVVPALGARRRYQWYASTFCTVRGQFRLGPLTIMSGDPFGLFLTPRKLGETDTVIVYPQTVPVTRFDLPTGNLSGGEAERRRAQFTTTNAAGVREYVTGDSFNRIHWASSARKDRLMVKEFEVDPQVDVWLFVDFARTSLIEDASVRRLDGQGTIIPSSIELAPSSEEYGVVIAASLTTHFIETGRALGFAAYVPHREVYQPERGVRQQFRIMQTLAVARSFSEYTLAQMLALETPFLTRGTTLVIITASLDPTWIAEAQLLTRKGVRPVCVLLDPSSFGGHTPPDDARAMLRLGRIPSFLVRRGDDITNALAQRPL